MKSISSLYSILIASFLFNVTFVSGQGTAKKASSNSGLNKAYHHVTAKYNGYYNAQVKLKEGIKSLESGYIDNYNQILDMYKFLAVPDVKAASSALDQAMIKAGVDIKLHPRSVFADDCYLLIGQAQYVKRDYESAEKTFSWVITTFDPNNKNSPVNKPLTAKEKQKQRAQTAKEKQKEKAALAKAKEKERERIKKLKEQQREDRKAGRPVIPIEKTPTEELVEKPEDKEKKKNYLIKHRPVRQDAMLWLARTQIERDKFDEAMVWLNKLEKDPKLMKAVKGPLAAIKAYYFLKQKKYSQAIEPLEKAIKLAKKRKEKARYAYIVAQIYQLENRDKEAYAAYERVIKLHPAYEMEFSARLNMIKNTFDDGVALANAETALKKLLKDEKNEEYKDQIYFTLASIAFKGKNETKAIGYLKQSVYYNFGNKAQKGESYLKLADTFYKKENYVAAKYYYDSTMTELAKNDSRYDLVELRSNSLTDIAANISIIEQQDSFLRIKGLIDGAKVSEYMAIAQKIKDDEAKAAAAKTVKKPGFNPRAKTLQEISSRDLQSGGGASKKEVPLFWAYNLQDMQKEKRDFEKLWGTRKLTDNWRRSNRNSGGDEIEIQENEEQEILFDLTKEEAVALFKKIGVPMDEAAITVSENKVIDAMSALGTLYRERLDNIKKSVDILETLVTRFPKNKYELESFYALYLQHTQLKNIPAANKYKAKILSVGAGTKFAKAIADPNFLAGEEEKERRVEAYYNEIYTQFTANDFTGARDKIDKTESLFGKEYALQSKFALLAAMCTGGIDGKAAYEKALQEVVSKYEGTEDATKAKEILGILSGKEIVAVPKKEAISAGDDDKIFVDEESGFTVNNKSQHYVVVVYDAKKLKQTDAISTIADYNKKYHRLKHLRTSGFLIDINTPTILIRRFDDKKGANEYTSEVQKNEQEFMGIKDGGFQILSINQDNYKLILRDRSKWAIYSAFYAKYYQ